MNLPSFNLDVNRDSDFVGREVELDVLARELLDPEPRIVVIVGPPGTGKTALAMMFARLHGHAFPGGVCRVSAASDEPLAEAVAAQLPTRSEPHLVILDDLDVRPRQRDAEITELRRSRPSARLLCVSRGQTFQDAVALKLENLSGKDFRQFIRRFSDISAVDGVAALFDMLHGNPFSALMLGELIRSKSLTPRELLSYLTSFSYSGLLGANGRPLALDTPAERQIITDVSIANDDLLRHAYANPQVLYDISPRRFEEFVAEVLQRLGYEVTLTPASSDGGKDIYAARKDHLGSFLFLVECKKYAPDHRVGVGLIRQLNGVVQAERATAGILATTSFFTRGAKELQARLSHQISLKDYIGLQEWLRRIFGRR